MGSRVRTTAALATAAVGIVAALVSVFEVVARALDLASGRMRWQIPVAAAVLLLVSRAVRPVSWDRLAAVATGVGTSLSALVAATGSLSGSGIGRLQTEVIVAGLLAGPLVVVSRHRSVGRVALGLHAGAMRLAARRSATWIGLGIVVGACLVGWALLLGTPLGHDEAVYAVKARSWTEGTADSGFRAYRPIGMPVVGFVLLQLSHAETVLRVFGLAGLVLLVVMTWCFARRLFGAGAGVAAAGSLIVAPSVLRRTPEFLNDLFTAGLIVGIAFLLWRHLGERRSDRLVIWVGPLAAISFYLRYGSLVGLAAVTVAAVFVWPSQVWRSRRVLAGSGALFVALLVPHAVYAIAETGSITGVLDAAADVAGREYVGEGLVDYVAWAPSRLAGPVAAAVGALGIGWAVWLAWRRHRASTARGVWYLVTAAAFQVVVLGLISHAEERFVFAAVAMLVIAGSGAVAAIVRSLPAAAGLVTVGVLAVALLGWFVASVGKVDRQLAGVATSRAILLDVSEAIEGGPQPCVVMTSSVPEIAWYSRCAAYRHDNSLGRRLAREAEAGYVVLFDNAKDDAFRGHVDELIADSGEPVFLPSVGGSVGDARIWTLR